MYRAYHKQSLRRATVLLALVLGSTGVTAVTAGGAAAATVEVRVSGVTPGRGKINVAVCDKERFLKDCAYSGSAPANAAETVVKIEGVPAGTWAVLAYQDENRNDKLDRNLLGIPSENYGFSRAARGKFGPPGFTDAAIEVQQETVVAPVTLR